MEVHGVGLTTDLALIATRGHIVDRGDYLVARTPDDPGYYYGNLLVLPAAPRPGEVPALLALFAREVAIDRAIRHVTLCWDGVTGDAGAAAELVANGFELEVTHVMTARTVRAAAPPPDIELRPLAPDELARTAELAFAIDGIDHESHRQFLHRRAAWKRELVARRLARFWGAFEAQTLVASLGLAGLGRLGRYQDVQTAPSHRQRGIAAALLAAAANEAVSPAPSSPSAVDQLVIRTALGGEAERLYQRAGFQLIERTVSACRAPPLT